MSRSRALVDEALAMVQTLDVDQARGLLGRADVCFVDLRESFERRREGRIAGDVHAPRGLIEFWFDPEGAWARPELTRPGCTYLLYCALGWRSALAARTLQDLGVARVCHLGGGFSAWKAAGAPAEPPAAD